MNNIESLLEQHGVSKTRLKQALNYDHLSRVINYTSGIRQPSLGECRRITEAMNSLGIDCTLDDVFPQDKAA